MDSTSAPEPAETQAEPHENHRWLQQLVGEWTCEGEAQMGPDKPPEKFIGTESVRAVGEFWILGEGRGPLPDGSASTMLLTLGYDQRRERFVGTWVGSMMPFLWVYDGALDQARKVLTLDCEGPDMTGAGGTAKYRDIIELVSGDHRVLRSNMQGADGQWQQLLETHYKRVK